MTRWEGSQAKSVIVDLRPRDALRRLFKSWGHCSPAADADDAIEALLDDGWSLVAMVPEPGVFDAEPAEEGTWMLRQK